MSVKDFSPRPDGAKADSNEFMSWVDELGDRQNIDNQLTLTAPVPVDKVMVFDASASKTYGVTLAALLRPATPAGVAQSATNIYGGTGAPSNGDGQNGDFYFRSDGGALTSIYHKRVGAWVGIV
jgi:hypothetical protein